MACKACTTVGVKARELEFVACAEGPTASHASGIGFPFTDVDAARSRNVGCPAHDGHLASNYDLGARDDDWCKGVARRRRAKVEVAIPQLIAARVGVQSVDVIVGRDAKTVTRV